MVPLILGPSAAFSVVSTRTFDPPLLRGGAGDIVVAYSDWPVEQVDTALILAASTLEGMKVAKAKGRRRGKRPKAQCPARKPTWSRSTTPASTARANSPNCFRRPLHGVSGRRAAPGPDAPPSGPSHDASGGVAKGQRSEARAMESATNGSKESFRHSGSARP